MADHPYFRKNLTVRSDIPALRLRVAPTTTNSTSPTIHALEGDLACEQVHEPVGVVGSGTQRSSNPGALGYEAGSASSQSSPLAA